MTTYSMPEKIAELKKKLESNGIDFDESPPTVSADIARINVFNCTDLGNSERFHAHYRDRVRFCHKRKMWYLWDGLRWLPDEQGAIKALAEDTIRRIYSDECASAVDDEQRQKLAKHAMRSESRDRISAMLELSQHRHPIPITPAKLDQKNYTIVWRNTVMDLKPSIKTRDPNPEDLMSMCAGTTIDGDPGDAPKCPRWLRFLREIMNGDDEMVEFLQRAVGYTLTGDVREQCLFFLHGSGKNGKSTFITMLYKLLGEYAIKIPTSALMAAKHDNSPQEIARLPGKRLAIAAEADDRHRFSETTVKDLTGGDVMTARELYARTFEFTPVCKLWIYGNSKPRITGTDEGIWRRIRLIPFNVSFEEREDVRLMDDLEEEMPQIALWAAQGASKWIEVGLGTPKGVQAATSEYRADMDQIAEFIESHCFIGPQFKATASSLFTAYRKWCDNSGERCLSQRALGLELTKRGYGKQRTRVGIQWVGIGVQEFNSSCEPYEPCEPSYQEFSTREKGRESPGSVPYKVHVAQQGSHQEQAVVQKCINCIHLMQEPCYRCAVEGEGSTSNFDEANKKTNRQCRDFEAKPLG